MDILNVASTGMYTILALFVNFKENACKKMNVIAKISDTHYISLTPDKILNSLVYRTLFYVNIYGSYKLSKNSPVFLAHPVHMQFERHDALSLQFFPRNWETNSAIHILTSQ